VIWTVGLNDGAVDILHGRTSTAPNDDGESEAGMERMSVKRPADHTFDQTHAEPGPEPLGAVTFAVTPPGVSTGVRRLSAGADPLGGAPVPSGILDILRRR